MCNEIKYGAYVWLQRLLMYYYILAVNTIAFHSITFSVQEPGQCCPHAKKNFKLAFLLLLLNSHSSQEQCREQTNHFEVIKHYQN